MMFPSLFILRTWGRLPAFGHGRAIRRLDGALDVGGRGYDYMHFYMDSCLTDAGMALSPPL
jgi:hypothetical protein